RDHQVPLGHLGQRPEQARRRLVQRLKWRTPPDAMIDAGLAPPERARQPAAVHAARPANVPGTVVFLGPLALQHRLRAAVTDLLLPIRAHRVPTVVPDHGGGTEAERPSLLL